MTEGSGRPLTLRQRQQQRTRRDLTDAAVRVISRAGWDKTTLDMIAEEAGSSRGTVYSYFPGGRDEVIATAYRQVSQELVDAAQKAAAGRRDWRERILCYAEAYFQVSEDPHLGRFFNILGPQILIGGDTIGSGSRAFTAAFVEQLHQARDSSQVLKDVDLTSLAVLLVGALREAATQVTVKPEEAATHLATFRALLDALT